MRSAAVVEDAIVWSTLLSILPSLTGEEDVSAGQCRVLVAQNKDIGYLPYQSVDKDLIIFTLVL